MSRRRRKSTGLKKSKIWNIALYIRLSREDGNDVSLSVQNQKIILDDYVKSNFEDGESVIVDYYIDDGKTGTDTNRPDFMRMEQDIRDGKVNCVIVKYLARAFRNNGDQTKFIDEFIPLHNARFISISNPFLDTYASQSGMNLEVPIHGIFNEQFAACTSMEIRKTFDMKRRKGEFIGAFAPYGYKKNPHNKNALIVDEEVVPIIKDIFNWFLYGREMPNQQTKKSMSIQGIARELNENNIPCPSEYKKNKGYNYQNPNLKYKEHYWQGGAISRMLKNRVYIGDMIQGKNRVISYKIHKQVATSEEEWFVVEDTHEAIIEPKVFEEVQKRLLRDTRTAPGEKEIHLFSGFLKCADCDRGLHRKKSKDIVYYYCRTQQVAKDNCSRPSMRLDKIEKSVLQAIQSQIKLIINLSDSIDKINEAPRITTKSNRLDAMLKVSELELEKLKNISCSLYADWKNGDITKEEYHEYKATYTEQIEKLEINIAKIRDDCQVIATGVKSSDFYFQQFLKHRTISTLDRDILIDLVDKIVVHKDKKITIYFNYADQFKQIVDFIENNNRELKVTKSNIA